MNLLWGLVKQDLPVLWEDVLKEFVLFLQSNEPAYFGVFSFPFGIRGELSNKHLPYFLQFIKLH